MIDIKRVYFYNKLVKYADISNDEAKNKDRLKNLIVSISDDCVTKFFSEFELFISLINNNTDFEELYDYVCNFFDTKLIMTVINECANVNKRSALFYEYYNVRKYGFILQSNDGSSQMINTIRKYLSLGASLKDIESFMSVENTAFSQRRKLIEAYLDTVIFSDSSRENKKEDEILRLKA